MAYSNQFNVPWEVAPIRPPPEFQWEYVQTGEGPKVWVLDHDTYDDQFSATVACTKALGLWCYDHGVEFSFEAYQASLTITIQISFAGRHYSHAATTVDHINRLIQGLPWHYMLTRERPIAPNAPSMPDGYGHF